jgi:hypothetical protein
MVCNMTISLFIRNPVICQRTSVLSATRPLDSVRAKRQPMLAAITAILELKPKQTPSLLMVSPIEDQVVYEVGKQ